MILWGNHELREFREAEQSSYEAGLRPYEARFQRYEPLTLRKLSS